MPLSKDKYVHLTLSIAKTPFSVSIVTEGCTTPWLLSVSSNAFVINHVVVYKGELAAWSTWISTVSGMAICEKKKVHCDNDWCELSEEALRVVLLPKWFPYCGAYHGYFFKVRCLRVVVVGVNLIFYICAAPVLFGGGVLCLLCLFTNNSVSSWEWGRSRVQVLSQLGPLSWF